MKIDKINSSKLSNNFQSLIDKNKFDKSFIYQQEYELIKLYKLEDYIKNIVLSSNMNTYFPATYSYISKKIIMYINNILDFQLKNNNYCYETLNKQRLAHIYSAVYGYLAHEITHAIQRKKWNEKQDSIEYDIIEIVNTLKYNNYNFYKYNHDLFPHEHHATSNSALLRNQFMFENYFINEENNYLSNNKNEFDVNMCNQRDAAIMILNYEILNGKLISPFEKFLKLTEKYDIYFNTYKIEKCDILEKILFGFPIDIDVFKEIEQVSIGKKKIKNINKFIKSL